MLVISARKPLNERRKPCHALSWPLILVFLVSTYMSIFPISLEATKAGVVWVAHP